MLHHPFKVLLALGIMVVVCWASTFVILHTKVCCICGSYNFVPQLKPSFNYFYCEKCFVEMN